MSEEKNSIQAQSVENEKSNNGTLTLYTERDEAHKQKEESEREQFEELYETYLDLYKKQTVGNPFFDIKIPEETEKENHSCDSDYRVRETTETTSDGFVIKRGISHGKPYVELLKYKGDTEVVAVPDYVTAIGNMDTFMNDNIKKIVVPEKVTGISLRAFSARVRENIEDEQGLCIVGKFLVDFLGNAGIVTIPAGVEEITSGAFAGNTSVTTVYLPKSIKVIGNQAFAACNNLSEVVFSSETEELDCIDFGAFRDCPSLKIINPPK